MKLALFTDTYYPQVNGVARTLTRWSEHLQRRGIEFQVFAPGNTEEETSSEKIQRISSIPVFLYPEYRLALPNRLSVSSKLDEFQPDLIHLATPFNVGLYGLRYARALQIPHVASYHTHFDQYLDYYRLKIIVPVYWRYIRWFHQTCAATYAPSYNTMDTLYRKGITGLQLWSRGVDCSLFSPDQKSSEVRERYRIRAPYILLYVGRVAPEKDVDILAEAMNGLPDSIRSLIHWLIVGDGPALPALKSDAPDNVSFTGCLEGEELAKTYASADLFVFPSSTETFGNVVLEAFASGLPVIGAKAGGVQEIVQHGQTGYLCRPRNAGDLIRQITELVENPEPIPKLGQEARKYALTRSWETIFDDLLASYRLVLERLGRAAM